MNTMNPGAYIGIDLGTTYSLVSTLQNGEAVVLPNALGEILTPSAVSLAEDNKVLVGAPAQARASTHPEQTALWFKRDMGTNRVKQLGSREFRPEELSALVLSELRQTAEQALGMPVKEAVVTVPAYFGELQRRATRDACEIAGLEVERIINEPTAAALAYGLHQRDREMRAVVLDLGGGTFDVTVLEIIEGVIEIQASAGDAQLGGEDFADLLTNHVVEYLKNRDQLVLPNSRGFARLREACEKMKRRLSQAERANLAIFELELAHGKADIDFELTRDTAEQVWANLLRRLEAPVRRALRDAEARPEDIDEVILVGGATRMPCVVRLATQVFGRLPLRGLPPDEAVAMGAAVQAALKAGDVAVDDMVVTDVAPFSLGIASCERLGGHWVEGLFSPILERGTVLPASRVERFATVEDNQRQIEVQVYQGEHSLSKDNQKLGAYTVKGIPPAAAGEQAIEVRFTYDLNGILEVDSTVLATKKTSSLVIESSPGQLSRDEVKKARKAMQQLKFHPRDALPNVTALSRAESLYIELSGVERQLLGQAMQQLRMALQTQDPQVIVHAREILLSRIAELGRR